MKSIYSALLTLSLLLLAPSVFALNTDDKPNTPSHTISGDATITQEQPVTDSKIIAIVMAVDKSEIAAARVAKKKNIAVSVLNYAKYLQQQHQNNLIQIQKLSKLTGLKPLQSATTADMTKQNKHDLTALKALNGVPFETAYIDAMVKGHTAGLQLIDTTLLKNVTNAQLKTFLVNFRAMVAHHLEMGIKLETQLKNQH